jgi:hypothetical protein
MARFEIDGVFYFMAAAALLLAFLAAGRRFTTTAPHHLERPFEILAPQAATLAHAPLDASDEPLSVAKAWRHGVYMVNNSQPSLCAIPVVVRDGVIGERATPSRSHKQP